MAIFFKISIFRFFFVKNNVFLLVTKRKTTFLECLADKRSYYFESQKITNKIENYKIILLIFI